MNKIFANENFPISLDERAIRLQKAEKAYGEFLTAIGFNWEEDPNMEGTPRRVAKMWLNEIASGCFTDEPKITTFENVNHYPGIVFSGGIRTISLCSHHNYPFFGVAHVAYIASPTGRVIGLSKLNRIVDFFARRPQVQENLTKQIHDYLERVLGVTQGIAVTIQAEHTCVKCRGVNQDSNMITTEFSGAFMDANGTARHEYFQNINMLRK